MAAAASRHRGGPAFRPGGGTDQIIRMTGAVGLDVVALRRLLARRAISPVEIVQDLAARIAARERWVRAWVRFDPAPALAQARALMRGPRRGLLWGIPLGVKDVIETRDFATEYGSRIYRRHRPAADAAVVAEARRAGAIILGKTQTNEFAGVAPAPTANPWRLTCSPGGSSSGSAAAVADGMVPLALGTQTGGSTIRPASYCGIVAIKPTFGLLPRAGVKPLAESLDTVGIFARRVSDAMLALEAVAARALPPAAPRQGPPRFGFWDVPGTGDLDAAMRETVRRLAEELPGQGAQVHRLAFSATFSELPDAHLCLLQFEARAALAHERRCHEQRLSPALRELLDAGERLPWSAYLEAQAAIAACRDEFARTTAAIDALVVPAAAGEAPPRNRPSVDRTLYGLWTALHVPCIALPAAISPSGLPLGIQLVGRSFEDRALLATAAWLERRLATLFPMREAPR